MQISLPVALVQTQPQVAGREVPLDRICCYPLQRPGIVFMPVSRSRSLSDLVSWSCCRCGPCKLVEKPLANLEKEFEGRLKVVKIEADPNPSLVEKYKVYGLPTFVLFKDGRVIDGSQKEGAIAEKQLRAYLEQHKVI